MVTIPNSNVNTDKATVDRDDRIVQIPEINTRLSKNCYIAIEGVNLVGKSTVINHVKENSKYKDNIDVYHEPDSNTVLGKFVRENVSQNDLIKDYYVKNALYLLGIRENTLTSYMNRRVHLTSRSILSNITYSELKYRDTINIIRALRIKSPDMLFMLCATKRLLEKRLSESTELDVNEAKGINYLMKKQKLMEANINVLVKNKLLDPKKVMIYDVDIGTEEAIKKVVLNNVDNILSVFESIRNRNLEFDSGLVHNSLIPV